MAGGTGVEVPMNIKSTSAGLAVVVVELVVAESLPSKPCKPAKMDPEPPVPVGGGCAGGAEARAGGACAAAPEVLAAGPPNREAAICCFFKSVAEVCSEAFPAPAAP
jgi:hypothetical protein